VLRCESEKVGKASFNQLRSWSDAHSARHTFLTIDSQISCSKTGGWISFSIFYFITSLAAR
jgi:hypothetical protein